jgi:hypothetical protein
LQAEQKLWLQTDPSDMMNDIIYNVRKVQPQRCFPGLDDAHQVAETFVLLIMVPTASCCALHRFQWQYDVCHVLCNHRVAASAMWVCMRATATTSTSVHSWRRSAMALQSFVIAVGMDRG